MTIVAALAFCATFIFGFIVGMIATISFANPIETNQEETHNNINRVREKLNG